MIIAYPYNEIDSLKRFKNLITVKQYGNDYFVLNKQPPSYEDKQTAQNAIKHAYNAAITKEYDIIILDEVCVSVYFKLISFEDLMPLLNDKPDEVELILTGRYCPQEWIDKADLVTEMVEVKHYYQQGVLARRGFES
jgi:cob(I)alamin adenosyltransferase